MARNADIKLLNEETIEENALSSREYKYGFVTDIEEDRIPAGLNEDVIPARVRGIIDAVQRYYPDLRSDDFDGIEPWRGLRPCSPDGLPYLGRTARYDNLVVATGHAMMGITLGPITGRLAADILSGEQPEMDLALLSPDRYH